MKRLAKYALAALLAGGGAIAASTPASAEVGVTFGFGSPGYYHGYGYHGYGYGRPCWFYRRWGYPAPARCYRDYYGYYGSDVFVDGGYVYRDRDDYWRRHGHDHDGRWHDGERHDGDWDRHDGDGDRGGDRWHDHDRR
jgi:hypothetical protein